MTSSTPSYTITPNSLNVVLGIRFCIEICGYVKALRRPMCLLKKMFFNRLVPYMINPSAQAQLKMRKEIKCKIESYLPLHLHGVLIFPPKTPLLLQVTFFIQRPDSHFKNGKRDDTGVSNLKKKYKAASKFHTQPPDIDNRVKFILDSPMEGVVYQNDSAIVDIKCEKVWDNKGACKGRTRIVLLAKEIDLTVDDGDMDGNGDVRI